jgi:hypothetical protein
MVRKTISLDDTLWIDLEENGVLNQFKNFSELVSLSLSDTLQKIRLENYRQQIAKAAADPMVKADIDEIMEDFKYVDGENNAF